MFESWGLEVQLRHPPARASHLFSLSCDFLNCGTGLRTALGGGTNAEGSDVCVKKTRACFLHQSALWKHHRNDRCLSRRLNSGNGSGKGATESRAVGGGVEGTSSWLDVGRR